MIFDLVPGAAASPMILHVPHASRRMSDLSLSGLLVDAAALAEELDHLTDAHTDVIAGRAASAARTRPWIFENRWSRLVVDPERFPDEREEMRAVGMGAIYTHGFAGRRLREPDVVRDQTLLRKHFSPYSTALGELVAERRDATGRAVVIDVHSYATSALPYELHGDDPRPPICLGTDRFHTPSWLLDAATAAFGTTGVNTPFRGCYVPLAFYERDPAVSSLMIEIRRDQYMTEPGGPFHPGLSAVAAALTTLIDAV
jgi:N-formylglutamate deformylase